MKGLCSSCHLACQEVLKSLMFAWKSSIHVWAIDAWCSPGQAREGAYCEDWASLLLVLVLSSCLHRFLSAPPERGVIIPPPPAYDFSSSQPCLAPIRSP